MSKELIELCYNIPGESIYGEITYSSLKKLMGIVIPSLPSKLFKSPLGIVDIGSGSGMALCSLGKIFMPYQCFLIGLEASETRVDLSKNIMQDHVTPNVVQYKCEHVDVMNVENLPQVHVSYSFDKTFPYELMKHIESLQFKSFSLQFVITSKPKIYRHHDNRWTEIGMIPCRMQGSQSGVNFHVFQKKKSQVK
jgi:hypothetical protein